jgi:hypothetical protein
MTTSHMKMGIQPAVEILCVSAILYLGQWTVSNIMFVTEMLCGLCTSGDDVYNMENRSYKFIICYTTMNYVFRY